MQSSENRKSKAEEFWVHWEAEMTGLQCTECWAHTQGSTAPPNLKQDGEKWEALIQEFSVRVNGSGCNFFKTRNPVLSHVHL